MHVRAVHGLHITILSHDIYQMLGRVITPLRFEMTKVEPFAGVLLSLQEMDGYELHIETNPPNTGAGKACTVRRQMTLAWH